MTIRTISACSLCALLSVLGTAASANPTTGTLSGQVRDIRGRPIVHAQVKIVETGEITATDSQGTYIFCGEDPGIYTITIRSAQYKAETLTTTVRSDTTQRLDFCLVQDSVNDTRIVKPIKPGTAIISVISSQGHRALPDPFADLPQETFQGDLGLHSTARSR